MSAGEQSAPLVSVAVITYNHAGYVRDCLNGLVNQSCDFAYEIVVGDDCSTDGTREVVKEYMDRYQGLIKGLLHGSNMGAVPNLLAVAKACRGDFIAVCEGDDYWIDSRKLAKQAAALQANNACDLVFNPALGKSCDDAGDDRVMSYYGGQTYLFPAEDIIAGRGGFMPTAAVMFRKSVLQKIPDWFASMVGCDDHLKVLAAARGGALYIPNIMSVYRISSKGSWTEKFTGDGAYQVRCLKEAWQRSFDLQAVLDSQYRPAFDKRRRSYLMQLMVSKIASRSDKADFLSMARKDISTLTYLMAFASLNVPGVKLLRRLLRAVINMRVKITGQHNNLFG